MARHPVYAFEAPPAAEELHTFEFASGDSQLYAVASVQPYTRTDGQPSAVITWRSTCSTCGSVFTFVRGLRGRIDVRRCRRCISRRQAIAIRSRRFRPRAWKG